MSQLIAVTGKGGTGKTTTAAALVRILRDGGVRPVLAVDADPNSTLAPLLGVHPPARISDIRKEMMEEKAKTTGVPKERLLEQRLQEYMAEAEGFDLLTMGHPEGPGCYCYVNNLVRHALASLKKNYPAIVVDNEAGMEHLSRINTSEIDCLVMVSEPTAASARSVARISELADSLPVSVKRRTLVWNKVTSSGVPKSAEGLVPLSRFDAVIRIPFSESVAGFSAEEKSVMEGELPEDFHGLMDVCIMGRPTDKSK